ncbi:MarR family winged helix-turn-helix transcriptional regulator [Microbacterium sp. LWH7-1.2]|uniref:MarR family winged helix-turn-helix transcriptional regulator n=1 Tax=Microbacterium sp. LWH7-1.2 TaxID=3135257 RepID=UPI003139768A
MTAQPLHHGNPLATTLYDIVRVLQSHEISQLVGDLQGTPLSASSVRALWFLGRGSDPTQSELAREMGVSDPTASKLLGRLEELGLVRRVRGSDRRTRRVALTTAGVAAARAVYESGDQLLDSALGELRPDAVARLIDQLEVLRAGLRAQLPGGDLS